jgi:hypothetical protein
MEGPERKVSNQSALVFRFHIYDSRRIVELFGHAGKTTTLPL